METEVLEHSEARVNAVVTTELHHSALLNSKGKQGMCAGRGWLWALGLHQAKQVPAHSSSSSGTRERRGYLLEHKANAKEDNSVYSRRKEKQGMAGKKCSLVSCIKKVKICLVLSPFTLLVISIALNIWGLMVSQSVNYRSQWSNLSWSDKKNHTPANQFSCERSGQELVKDPHSMCSIKL